MYRSDAQTFLEPCVIQTDFADGLAAVEIDRNGNGRVTFYADVRDMASGLVERHIVARLVIPQDGMVDAGERMVAAGNSAGPSPARIEALRGMN